MNNLMVFEEMPDNTGLAQVRRRHQVTASPNEDSLHLSQDAANVNVPECYVIATIGSPELLTSPAANCPSAELSNSRAAYWLERLCCAQKCISVDIISPCQRAFDEFRRRSHWADGLN